MKRQSWLSGLALLLCLSAAGCNSPNKSNTRYIDAVKGFRPQSNGLTVETLLDLQTYPGLPAAAVTSRDWQAVQDGANWAVSFIATSPSEVRIWKWQVDSGGEVTPANDLATALPAYDTTMEGRMTVATPTAATPNETPVAVVTPTPITMTPVPTVTVTVTPAPEVVAAAPSPVPKPTRVPELRPHPVEPPPPPSVIEYKGVMQSDSRMVATLVIDGVYYQASTGDTLAGQYRVVRITPTEVDLRYQNQDVRAVMAPHAGGVQFTPAAPDTPLRGPIVVPQNATPGETPIELIPR